MVDFVLVKSGLRGLQLLCTLIVTALIGNVIATNVSAASSATAAINFSMFVAVVAWLACLFALASLLAASLAIPVVQLALDGAATLFTFIDAVVLAAKLKAVNCARLDPKDLPGDYIAFGSMDDTKRCREIQASTAFMWFLFASFVATLFLTFRDFRSGGGYGGGSVRSKPSMVQVRV